MRITTAFIAALVAIVAPCTLFAHETGESYEAEIDGYAVDVGYSTSTPDEGESVVFDFGLEKGGKEVVFSDVWVTVTSAAGETVLATGVHNSAFGGPRLSYVFPGPGSYSVAVRYEQDTEALAAASFPMTVTAQSSGAFPIDSMQLFIGLFVGALSGYGLAQYLGRRKDSPQVP
jgi:hypothetical protein